MRQFDPDKGIISWFANNPVAANLLMAILIIAGLFSAFAIRKEFFPEMNLQMVQIRVAYPGAAPLEVEEGICLKIEEKVKNIEGLKKITSLAREGMGTVTLEVEEDYDIQKVLDEAKIQVDSILSFPVEAEKPLIYEQKQQQNVIWVTIAGEQMDERTKKDLATEIRNDLVAMPEVSYVEIVGARDYEVSIELSESRLREYNLSLADVVSAVRSSSVNMPGGTIKSSNGEIMLRTNNQAYTGYDFANVVLLTRPDGTILHLGDVASINDGFEEREGFSRFDSKPSVSVRAKSIGNQNDLDIAEAVRNYVAEKRLTLPESVEMDYWGDTSFYLKDRLDMMLTNMAMGAGLVFLVLALFLRLKLAFWVMVGLPICFLGTLFVMTWSWPDLSINMMTLFAFILVLGILVDDAIIIGEASWSAIEEHGMSKDNVIRGARSVAMPATFGVLTTIAAFIPMLMMPGAWSPIWASIGLVVMLCLVFSLIESKLILPAHLAHMKLKTIGGDKPGPLTRVRRKVTDGLHYFINHQYEPFLRRAVKNRYLTLVGFVCVFFIVSVGFTQAGLVRWVGFPNIPSDFIRAELNMNEGTNAELTNESLAFIEQSLRDVNADIQAEYGVDAVNHMMTWSWSNTEGIVFVELNKLDGQAVNSDNIITLWREKVGTLPGVKSLGFGADGGPGAGQPVSIRLVAQDINELRAAAKMLKDKLATYDGVYDIADSFTGGNREISLELKPEAKTLGITMTELARQVRYGFYGAEAQRFQRGDDEVKVMVRYPLSERRSIDDLEKMLIRTSNGEVPFNRVANYELTEGYASIRRVDGKRANTITADVDKSRVEPGEINKDIFETVIPEIKKRFPGISTELDGEAKETSEMLTNLAKGGGLAIFVIFALMAIPLKSYIKPLIVMSTIPFGIIGAIVGHMILGMPMSTLSMFGLIALAGVVVNDSLIMVDFVGRAREEGLSLVESAIQAGTKRFRAIVLTSLTTFFGLLPITFETSFQAKIVIPMAISLSFGIVFATVVTLIWVPCLYAALADGRNFFRRKLGSGRHQQPDPA